MSASPKNSNTQHTVLFHRIDDHIPPCHFDGNGIIKACPKPFGNKPAMQILASHRIIEKMTLTA